MAFFEIAKLKVFDAELLRDRLCFFLKRIKRFRRVGRYATINGKG